MSLPFRGCALAALVALLWVPAAAAEPERFVPGTYQQIDTVTKKPLALGNQIVIIAGKGGRLGFSVNAIRQTDAGQGFVAGVLPALLPATWTKNSPAGNCRLLFEGAGHGLKVTQDMAFGDCGFGEGVSASGTYALIREKAPET